MLDQEVRGKAHLKMMHSGLQIHWGFRGSPHCQHVPIEVASLLNVLLRFG